MTRNVRGALGVLGAKLTRKVGGAACFLGEGYRLVVPQSRGLIGALLRRSQSFSGVLRRSQSIARLPVVPSSRCLVVPESVWVGKNLPAMRETTRKARGVRHFLRGKSVKKTRNVCGRRVFFGGGVSSRSPVVSWSCWRATQAFSVILRRSQSFSGVPRHSQSIARFPVVPQSRRLVVPESVWVGKNLPAMRKMTRNVRGALGVLGAKLTRKVGGAACFLGEGYRLVVPQSRGLIGALLRRSQSFSGVLRRSQSIARLPVVPSSRCLVVPESVWVGKNLPAMRETTRKARGVRHFLRGKSVKKTRNVGGASCVFLGEGYRLVVPWSCRPVVSWSYWRATQAFSGVPRRSQSIARLPVIPQSRGLVVPDNMWVGKNLPAK